MKKWIEAYRKWNWERKMFWTVGFVSLLPIVAALIANAAQKPADEGDSPAIDTFIPKGYVLAPIDVVNFEALDSILGKFGVVDLFQGGENTPQRLVARNVRLLRAPNNPARFAILARENQVAEILKTGSSFVVTLKHPGKDGTEFVKDELQTRRQIVYEGK